MGTPPDDVGNIGKVYRIVSDSPSLPCNRPQMASMARKVQDHCDMATTGDKCERSGFYLVSGACGHAAQRTVKRSELLPHRHICGRPTNWTLLRELSTRTGNIVGNIQVWE